MVTNYILYDTFSRMFVASGSHLRYTFSLNYAKHFASEWAATKFKERHGELECFIIRKVVRY